MEALTARFGEARLALLFCGLAVRTLTHIYILSQPRNSTLPRLEDKLERANEYHARSVDLLDAIRRGLEVRREPL